MGDTSDLGVIRSRSESEDSRTEQKGHEAQVHIPTLPSQLQEAADAMGDESHVINQLLGYIGELRDAMAKMQANAARSNALISRLDDQCRSLATKNTQMQDQLRQLQKAVPRGPRWLTEGLNSSVSSSSAAAKPAEKEPPAFQIAPRVQTAGSAVKPVRATQAQLPSWLRVGARKDVSDAAPRANSASGSARQPVGHSSPFGAGSAGGVRQLPSAVLPSMVASGHPAAAAGATAGSSAQATIALASEPGALPKD